ncbi:SUKH-4 family immunity protein [Streptomyces sp. NPDC048290]|uniref:SUKH-4 family immunity protein n=1 Tax=Streptomyces sp. NPDC048290 TaxID=3155811 RepID=UPI003423FBDA
MSTTGAVTAAITLTDHDLDLYFTQATTSHRSTDPAPPCVSGPHTVEPLRLGGAPGPVTTAYFTYDRPAAPAPRPPSPALRALTAFAAATEELAELRRRFAAQRASSHLPALFEKGADDTDHRTMTALIRPLAPAAGPGTRSGLTFDLPPRLLTTEFGPGHLARFEDVDFPAALTHEPTRRFLRETGLPEDGALLALDTDIPLPTLTEHYADDGEIAGALPGGGLPRRADALIRLGRLTDDGHALLVDGATGEVLLWSERETTPPRPLSTDVSTLAVTLWLLHRERALGREPSREPVTDACDRLAAAMSRALRSLDRPTDPAAPPPPPVDWQYWTRLLQDESTGAR